MKAISLWQPWASAMALGLKQIETRSWATSYRGDLVICSSKRQPDNLLGMPIAQEFGITAMRLGCALCVVELYDCVPADRVPYQLLPMELSLGDFTPGRFAWLTRNRRPLRNPVPLTGHQGLWELPEETAALIASQL